MNINNSIQAIVRPLIREYAHRVVRRDARLAGQIIAAKLHRDGLLTNSNPLTVETISAKTRKRLALIKNEAVKAGFTYTLGVIINGLDLNYDQKVTKINQLNQLIKVNLVPEECLVIPRASIIPPPSPEFSQGSRTPRVSIGSRSSRISQQPVSPQKFIAIPPPESSKQPILPPEPPAPQLPGSFKGSETPRTSLGAQSSDSSGPSSSLKAVKKVTFNKAATETFIYPAAPESVAGSDISGAAGYDNLGYVTDLDELSEFDTDSHHSEEGNVPENEEFFVTLPAVDYKPENIVIPDVDYMPMDEAGSDEASGGCYNLLMASGSEYKPHGKLIMTAAQDTFTASRSISLHVSLSEEEINALPTSAGLRALIVEKEYNERSSAYLVSLSPENRHGEKWFFIGVENYQYKFRKELFTTQNLVNK